MWTITMGGGAPLEARTYIHIHPYIKLVRVLGHVCRWSLEEELGLRFYTVPLAVEARWEAGLRCSTLCPCSFDGRGCSKLTY